METGKLEIPPDIGAILTELRKAAGKTQAEIAQNISIDTSKVSRIEKGGVSPSESEITKHLKAIGTPEAKEYLRFLKQDFSNLSRPPFRHPDRDILCEAERRLQKLDDFHSQPNIPGPLVGQATMYRDSLLRSANYLAELSHSVCYIGEIGVGKTTLICAQTGLILPDGDKPTSRRTVLATGGGRVTLCEVRIRHGSQYGITIEPQPDSEIYKLVADFCVGLKAVDTPENDPEQHRGVSREIERAIRSMTGLLRPMKRIKSSDRATTALDPAVELAQKSTDINDLQSEISSRLKLWQRTRQETWYDPSSGVDALTWLKNTFAAINNGKHPEFSLPKSIDVIIPNNSLRREMFDITLIDTKGVDETAARPDLQACIDDPRAIAVFCSKFNSAPDKSIHDFIKHLVETGFERTLTERAVLAVLPRSLEALAIKDDSGVEAETDEEGYDLKRSEVESALQRIGAKNIPIHFFNMITDDVASIYDAMIQKIREVRASYATRIENVADAINFMIENQEAEYTLAAQRIVIEWLNVFIKQHTELSARKRYPHEALLGAVEYVHPRTVWASTRRNGSWGNLNVYYFLGTGATADAQSRTNRAFDTLEGIIDNLHGQSDLEPARKFLKELKANVPLWREHFLDAVRREGELTYRPALEENYELWSACENKYGRGLPYRKEVAEILRKWFEDPEQEHLHELLEKRIEDTWKETVLEPLNNLCNSQDKTSS